MSLTYALIIELILLIDVTRRFRFLTAVHLVLLYIMCSQIVFFYGQHLVDDPGPESLLTYLSHVDFGVWTYLVIALITHSATFFAAPPKAFSTRLAMRGMVEAASRFIPYIATLCGAYVVFQLVVIDHKSMMFHAWYGAAPSRYDSNAITAIFKLYSLVAIISAAALPLAARTQSRVYFILLLFTTSWLFIYSLSSASRGAAVMVFVFAAAWLASAKRWHTAILIGNGLLLLIVLRSALTSRGYGEFGLIALPGIIANGFDLSGGQLRSVVVNLFQGIFVTTDGLTMNATFNPIYAWLSYSPLPSTFDGFDTILRRYEIRLGLYVPMSAISEAFLFGPVLLAVAVVTYWLALRSTLVCLSKGYISASLFSSLFLFAVFVQANAYPMRNTYRQFLIVIAINVVAMVFLKPGRLGGRLKQAIVPPQKKGRRRDIGNRSPSSVAF
ncbi:hypothetical protein FVA81_01625 (plasmid) [Rhizobium sp. WL3]|uniref:hypothetical protein n=1 Tax=Rhizobium sp. WL3 TaxID=2603277 RepID=UPI0011C1DE86|nr:hypothetical protein [Rhizobium sp. WL3]QEE43374.1 hypothetical protein FVA81_01625 [Rhizobium sp. WL3]